MIPRDNFQERTLLSDMDHPWRGITLLKGAEVNIDKDGRLDIDDETLARLDVVGIAVHSHFGLPRAEMTRRVIRTSIGSASPLLLKDFTCRVWKDPVETLHTGPFYFKTGFGVADAEVGSTGSFKAASGTVPSREWRKATIRSISSSVKLIFS